MIPDEASLLPPFEPEARGSYITITSSFEQHGDLPLFPRFLWWRPQKRAIAQVIHHKMVDSTVNSSVPAACLRISKAPSHVKLDFRGKAYTESPIGRSSSCLPTFPTRTIPLKRAYLLYQCARRFQQTSCDPPNEISPTDTI